MADRISFFCQGIKRNRTVARRGGAATSLLRRLTLLSCLTLQLVSPAQFGDGSHVCLVAVNADQLGSPCEVGAGTIRFPQCKHRVTRSISILPVSPTTPKPPLCSPVGFKRRDVLVALELPQVMELLPHIPVGMSGSL